jgi:hypothetical protein
VGQTVLTSWLILTSLFLSSCAAVFLLDAWRLYCVEFVESGSGIKVSHDLRRFSLFLSEPCWEAVK